MFKLRISVKASTVPGLIQERDKEKQTRNSELRVYLAGRDPADAKKGISDAVVVG